MKTRKLKIEQPPYTLAQVMENLSLIHGSQDLTWCRRVAADILERGIDALPTAQAQSRTRLEIAAPDLLHALKGIIEGDSPNWTDVARAAIAKAGGDKCALSDVYRCAALWHGQKEAAAKRAARKNGVPWKSAKKQFVAANSI